MVDIVESILPSRGAVRDYVEGQRATLEAAQLAGRLARVKIDLKDEAVGIFAIGTSDEMIALRAMLDEEIEALCADLRLASVTVQAQVERRARNYVKGAAIALAVFVFGIIGCVAIGVRDGAVGFGLPLIASVICFFTFSWDSGVQRQR